MDFYPSTAHHQVPMTETRDVCIVGGGVAGLSAGVFIARAGLDTLVVSTGESILNRNAHLENVPGFPAGINSRLFLDLTKEQADEAGCTRRRGEVTAVDRADDGRFAVAIDDGADRLRAEYVICASWADTAYLSALDVGLIERGSKTYLDVDERGETAVEGLYAAGRLAGKHHQVAVAAGHGADVALHVVADSDVPFYHDWVAPEGYFTGRERDVPPGCAEIDEGERRQRERDALERMRACFDAPHPDDPTMHPSVDDAE
jgi:thioredoxin reductase